jgi:hypothetical protein
MQLETPSQWGQSGCTPARRSHRFAKRWRRGIGDGFEPSMVRRLRPRVARQNSLPANCSQCIVHAPRRLSVFASVDHVLWIQGVKPASQIQ